MSTSKIIALVLLAATCSVAAAKNTPSSTTSTDVPSANNKWHASVKALYLQPNYGGNGLGYSSFSNYGTDFAGNTVEVNGASNHLSNLTPDRDWGYQLEGGFDFGTSNDVVLNWSHLDETTNGRLPQGTLFSGSASALYAAGISLKTQWDAVNLQLGQRFELNSMNITHLYAGFAFAQLQTTFNNSPRLTANGNPIFITNDQISYTGYGPRIGGDYTFKPSVAWGFYAKGAGSLLVGKAKQTVTGYRDLGGFNLYSTGNYNQSNNNVVVPELEANLGLKYDYQLAQGNLGFDAGYMFVTYIGALVSQVGSGVVSSSISNSSSTNFNLNGPYLGVTWTS